MGLICRKDQVLRYLGYKDQDIPKEINQIIDRTIEKAQNIISPAYCIWQWDLIRKNGKLFTADMGIYLEGESISAHLKECEGVYLFAATIGAEFERQMRISQAKNMTEAVILDCCGSALVEELCDIISAELMEKAKARGLYTTARFSPGYGDFPLSLQKDFLRCLDATKKIGLTCNEQFLMIPRKSVTAITGLSKIPQKNCTGTGCDICAMNKVCEFKKE